MNRYYVTSAYDVGGNGDELHLIKLSDGRIIGYSSEFDICTSDIAEASSEEACRNARWFHWDDNWSWAPAKLEEIREVDLDKFLIGSKVDMKVKTPVDPLD
ncbi:hypothetical protein V4C53_44775 [Paraburkholderia azotifigens]|uniref:hypothetical protein n=1 Tax=Paraburkholderia azotifigens TaxID=2057004 RepID=UPI003180DB11